LNLVLAIGVTLAILGLCFYLIGAVLDSNDYAIADLFFGLTSLCWSGVFILAAATALWWVWERV
jgi:hypothetical protein